jgi:hypothetical protein
VLHQLNDAMFAFAAHAEKMLLASGAAEGNRNADCPASGSGFLQVLAGHNRVSGFAPFAASGPPNRRRVTRNPVLRPHEAGSLCRQKTVGMPDSAPMSGKSQLELNGPIFLFHDPVPGWPVPGMVLRSRIAYATA